MAQHKSDSSSAPAAPKAKRPARSTKRKSSPPDEPEPAHKKLRANDAKATASDGAFPTPLTITPPTFRELLDRYASRVPDKLHKLDEARYESIPAAVRARRAKAAAKSDNAEEPSPHGYLTKQEVVQLVEWKLEHGTFRPALLGMARAHPEDVITSTTASAFAQLSSTPPDVSGALKTLCSLRGIGPATASLLLSCADPERVPFFSDELYRWMLWDGADVGKGTGWGRKIGYTDKEYAALREAVGGFLERAEGDVCGEVGALDMEKVAYVLGKSGQ